MRDLTRSRLAGVVRGAGQLRRGLHRSVAAVLLGLPLLLGFAASAQAQSTPELEFNTTHLTWNESQGCSELEYYAPVLVDTDDDGDDDKIVARKITGSTPQQRRQNALAASLPHRGNRYGAAWTASMELPSSAPGPTYQVRLTTKPMGRVEVTVHDPNDLISWGNNTHRTLSRVFVGLDRGATWRHYTRNSSPKPTLTFTPSNWDQWQTVKVKVACTDHFPDAVPLEHRMDRRINDQTWKVWVRVHEQTPPVEIVASALPPAGQTITLEVGETRDFEIKIGERMLPNGAGRGASVHLYTELHGYNLSVARRDGQPVVDGVTQDTMFFEPPSRQQWVRLEAVRPGETWLEISAERDFTWGHATRRHWTLTWPVTVEHPGICGRTKEVRDAIVGRISGVNRCHDVTPQHLAAISGTLGLGYIPAERTLNLQAGDFDGLTSLTHLDLEFAELSTLPAGIFDGLTALTNLDLDGNPITALPAGIFDGLTSLTRLTLTSSRIGTLPAGIFDDLTALTNLDLSSNQITALPAGIFDDLTALTNLRLHFNRLSTLPAGIFDDLTALTSLSLANNRFTTLPDGIFAKLTALNDLFLLRNSGAPFAPAVPDAGDDRAVATGAQVTLSGAAGAGGAWGDNVRLYWSQVDGPASNTTIDNDVLPGGSGAAAPTFTAPATPTVLHFRLTATPKGMGTNRGLNRSFDWVTITIGAGQGSPRQDERAGFETAEAQAPSCVSDALLADAQKAAGENWRDSPDHVERWSRVLAAFGVSNAYSNNPMTVSEARAQADRGLQRWTPVVEAMECLASPPAAPQEEAQPASGDIAPPAGPHTELIAKMVEWRNDPQWKSYKAHTDRWDRALLAFGEPVADTSLTPMTMAEAQAFVDRGWTRWVEVAAALHNVTTGTSGADTLEGTTNDDMLVGLGGADTLSGLGGNDELRGGDGDDDLSGGPGSDRFVFFPGETGAKAITDFASGDVIVLMGDGWSSVANILASVQAVGSGNYRYSLASGLSLETTNNRSLRAEDFVLE